MMTRQLEVSILAAPLGAIDPRALSQAWYAALRFTARGTQTTVGDPIRRSASGGAPHRPDQASAARPARAAADRGPLELRKRSPGAPYVEWHATAPRRMESGTLAVRIGRAFTDPRSCAKGITFSMGRGDARVHVLLQTRGEKAHLIALCRPEIRDAVERALSQARVALAVRGMACVTEGIAVRCF